MTITVSEKIAKPAVDIFPWIAEPDKAMRWQRNVKEQTILLDEPGIIGTTFKETVAEGGKSLEMHGTVTEYVKNGMMGFRLKSNVHEVDVRYRLSELHNGTDVSVDASINWKFPMNVVRLFMGRRIEKGIVDQLESELRELKGICEAR